MYGVCNWIVVNASAKHGWYQHRSGEPHILYSQTTQTPLPQSGKESLMAGPKNIEYKYAYSMYIACMVYVIGLW